MVEQAAVMFWSSLRFWSSDRWVSL